MVLGILGLVLCWLPFVGWLCALIGIILGALGMGKAKKVGGAGKGMAIAGLICGILGLLVGVILFVLATMAASAFEDYAKKGKKTEAQLQLRSIETKAKTFFIEKARFPKSAPEMPGPISSACPAGMLSRKPPSAWTDGWQEMGFHVDEDSRCSYKWTSEGVGATASGVAEATCITDCDEPPSVSRMRIEIVEGTPRATYLD